MEKYWIIVGFVIILIGGAYWHSNKTVVEEGGRRVPAENIVVDESNGKLKAAVFHGKLEEVNVGCFADGECYVVVGGKHVTTTLGWRQEVVGTVEGVEGFGDLEQHIGEEMEVYAQDKGDGAYTLYGSAGFYVKLLGKTI